MSFFDRPRYSGHESFKTQVSKARKIQIQTQKDMTTFDTKTDEQLVQAMPRNAAIPDGVLLLLT